jgi:hypothetical protein
MGTSVILSPGGIIRLSGALVWDNVIERCYRSVEASIYSDPSLGCLSKETRFSEARAFTPTVKVTRIERELMEKGHGIGIATPPASLHGSTN